MKKLIMFILLLSFSYSYSQQMIKVTEIRTNTRTGEKVETIYYRYTDEYGNSISKERYELLKRNSHRTEYPMYTTNNSYTNSQPIVVQKRTLLGELVNGFGTGVGIGTTNAIIGRNYYFNNWGYWYGGYRGNPYLYLNPRQRYHTNMVTSQYFYNVIRR